MQQNMTIYRLFHSSEQFQTLQNHDLKKRTNNKIIHKKKKKKKKEKKKQLYIANKSLDLNLVLNETKASFLKQRIGHSQMFANFLISCNSFCGL